VKKENKPYEELDQTTLSRAKRGETAACRALVLRYQTPVFALLSRMLGQGPHIEDLSQETFLRVFRALSTFQFDGKARLSTWILTIATRLALDTLRKKSRIPEPIELHEVASIERTDEYTERRLIGAAIERAIRSLSPEHQAVFLLREYHGLEYDEIAQALQLDLGTIKSRLSRARAILREALADIKEP
jgi:RNA polymerase sigma-70 factor (ECF subfamily)